MQLRDAVDQVPGVRMPWIVEDFFSFAGLNDFTFLHDDQPAGHLFLETQTQPEVGEAGYDQGAEILSSFFRHQLKPYLEERDLSALGRRVVECCLDGGTVEDYENLSR